MIQNKLGTLTLGAAVILTLLTACGGGGGGGGGDDAEDSQNTGDDSLLSGFFLDSAVEGLQYVTLEKTGENTFRETRPEALTTKSGKFKYEEGEYIQFYIGYISVAYPIKAKTKITPLDITADIFPDHSINIARFLQSLDDDADLTNGITIIEAVRNQAATYTSFPGFNSAFEMEILPIVDELTALTSAGTRSLIDASSAQTHLNATFNASRPGSFPFIYGVYSGTYSINVSNCSDPADNGIYNFTVELSVNNQNDGNFSGTATGSIDFMGEVLNENITFSGAISVTGDVSGDTSHTFVDSGGTGTFTGQLLGDTLTMINSGADTFGDTCSYTRDITVSR